jgi:hypothetical protein
VSASAAPASSGGGGGGGGSGGENNNGGENDVNGGATATHDGSSVNLAAILGGVGAGIAVVAIVIAAVMIRRRSNAVYQHRRQALSIAVQFKCRGNIMDAGVVYDKKQQPVDTVVEVETP